METEGVEAIEACRTCGIFYMTSSNYLRNIFQPRVEQPEMMLIRLELAQWKVEMSENDGFPQYVCITCIHEFQKIFRFRAACIETQEQFRHLCNLREENLSNIKIKTERPDPDEDKPMCDFIYVDDISDAEYDGTTPFNIPHVPIKEEQIEAATIPIEVNAQAVNVVESAANVNSLENSVVNAPLISTSQNENTTTNTVAVVSEKPFEHVECKLCQHISHNNDEHKQHLQKAHEIKNMECHICGKEFKNSTSARLKFHMKWHTLNKHVKCTLCGFVCNSKDALKEHKRANHSRINCKICRKAVLAKKIKSHIRNHELLTKFACEYCTETFSTKDQREYHIWQLHANGSETIPIDIAQEVDNDEQGEEILCQESEIDLLLYKFLCAHCDERFIEQVELETHVNQRHRSTTNTNLKPAELNSLHNEECQKMPENEINNQEINQIAIFEDYDNDNNCEEMSNESDLIRNSFTEEQNTQQLSHTTQTTFNRDNDEVNEKNYSNKDSYEVQHQNGGESSLAVSENLSCDSESGLARTLETDGNNALKSFACAKCAQTFGSIEQLRQHHENHLAVSTEQQMKENSTSKLKFKCMLCGKLFDLKFSLNRHLKKHNAPF